MTSHYGPKFESVSEEIARMRVEHYELPGNLKDENDVLAYVEAKSLLHGIEIGRKAAEPLLEVIEEQRKAIVCLQGSISLAAHDGVPITHDIMGADKIAEDILSSSAQVVEKYRKNAFH